MRSATVCTAILGMLLATGQPGAALSDGARSGTHAAHEMRIRLAFVNTDASDVLQALSLRTRANIVFPAQLKRPISLNVLATGVENALGYITAASGLAYRLVGDTYVVALPSDMKQALEPFATKAHLPLHVIDADDAAHMLEGALPYLSARPAGHEVVVSGADDDVEHARAILAEEDRVGAAGAPVKEVAVVQHVIAGQVATMLKTMFANLKIESVGSSDKPGGAVGIAGDYADVEAAKHIIQAADTASAPRGVDTIYRTYAIRYSSAPALKSFLDKAMPSVLALMSPERYSPPPPQFNPLSGSTFGATSSSGSAGGTSGAPGSTGGPSDSSSNGDTSGGGAGGAASSGSAKPKVGDRARALVLSGRPADVDDAIKLLEQVDVAPKQVLVDVKVIDTSPQFAEQLGLSYSWTPLQMFNVPQNQLLQYSTSGLPFNLQQPATGPNGLAQFSTAPWSIATQLNALTAKTDSKLLADPRILVLDNEDASIFIGDTIRAAISQSSVSGTTLQVAEFPVGIVLLVHPRINADNRITLHVHPVVSTVSSIGPDNLPQTSSREAETTVMLKDGQTIVIGGLIRDEYSKVVQEVPFLSRLPIIGELFRNRSTNKTHSDVLVFMTPHIVSADGVSAVTVPPAQMTTDSNGMPLKGGKK